MKFSIITPTIGRRSLLDTCYQLNKQTYTNWEHIVMLDVLDENIPEDIISLIQHPNRKIVKLNKNYNNYGNTPRHLAWEYVTGDYIGYSDDDDYFITDAFLTINNYLNSLEVYPDAIVYPCLRFGEVFFNTPPAKCMTATGQYMHRPIIKGQPVKWKDVPENDRGYLYDGEFVEYIKTLTTFHPIGSKPLYVVPSSHHGTI